MNDELDPIRSVTTDPVTGLYNHRYFLHEAERAVRRAFRSQQPLSILLLQLGGVSDSNFAQIAKLVRKAVRETDLIARNDEGELEFLLPDTSGPGAVHVAEKLRSAVVGAIGPECSAAIGISTYPENGGDAPALIARATDALKAASAPESGGVVRSLFAATVKIPAWVARRFSAPQSEGLGVRPSHRRHAVDDSAWTSTKFETGDKPLSEREWTTILGGWRLEGEEWVSQNNGNNVLIWKLPVAGSFRYVCEGWNEGDGEISILGHAFEGSQSAHWGYAFHVGADNNSCAKFSRLSATVLAQPGRMVEPGRRYRLEIEYDELAGSVVCFLDGTRVFEYRELLPFSGNQIGLYAWGPGAHLKPLEIRGQKTQLSAIELADDFFDRKDFKTAHQCYGEIAKRLDGHAAALQARLKSAQCLAHLERMPQARKEYAALKGTELEPFALACEGLQFFHGRTQVNARYGVEFFEDLVQRFPKSSATHLIHAVAGGCRERTRRFGATRMEDLIIRGRINRLARDSCAPPAYSQIRGSIESARVHWQLGEWKEALDETLQFQHLLIPAQYDVADFRLTSYVTALANNREDLLPTETPVAQIWEVCWFPDWCSGIIFHVVMRKGDPAQFIEQYHETVAAYPTLSQSLDLKHAVLLLYLATNRVQEAGEFLTAQILSTLKEADYFWTYWVGATLLESRQEALLNIFLEKLSAITEHEGRRSNMARVRSLIQARNEIGNRNFAAAAEALEDWPAPELVFHFSEGLVLQAFLSSLGFLKAPAREELERSLDVRLAGPELALADMFLRKKEPRPNSVFPHARWRPEFRLWLAYWLEAKGDKAGARAVAEPAVDKRYGLTHSQPALAALLARI